MKWSSEEAATTNRPVRTAIIVGIIIGLIYGIVLLPLQPAIEPTYVWAEVAVGLILGFAIAEPLARNHNPTWSEYRDLLLAAFIGLGMPIILLEMVNHILLPQLGITLPRIF